MVFTVVAANGGMPPNDRAVDTPSQGARGIT